MSVASLALVACGDDTGDAEENGDTGDTGVEENGGEENGAAETGSEDGAGDAEAAAYELDIDYSALSGNLSGSGASSFQLAIQEWTAEFEIETGVPVDYDAVGSGDGRSNFLNGADSFAYSDALMDEEEYEASLERCGDEGAFHVPAAIIPIAVAVNLDGVDELNLDGDTIAQIFSGEITEWDDEAIAEHNDGVDLPSESITVVHRSDTSGTTENFTEYLAEGTDEWDYEADGDWPSEVTAETGDGTTGVLSTAESVQGAITYSDAQQVEDAGLTTVNVQVGEEYAYPSPEAAAEALAASDTESGGADNNLGFDLARDIDEDGTYPIIQVTYTIWCNQYDDENEAELARAFAAYITSSEAQQLAADIA
ncbi:phosphate ABC transporter substrate-binding protein PstS [Nesterenkonia pannonica]|uniref:phosphate ABC transporter substrate-binding protein PstS n=1 Tax=Nesterenkonia pannonica TaxID=1548602 RepID=UPI00216464DB|nr:phosphate ABC transporter substrate-binding protein PstS [Nesterenkonia pannonica]